MLFDKGIIELPDRIQLCGSPHTAGFWKSFVEVEKSKRWSWNDSEYDFELIAPVITAIGTSFKLIGQVIYVSDQDRATQSLMKLRSGESIVDSDIDMSGLIVAAILAREFAATDVIDIETNWNTPAGPRSNFLRFLAGPESKINLVDFKNWLEEHASLLSSNGIAVTFKSFYKWPLPTSEELHRLSYITSTWLPESFGASLVEAAIDTFFKGELQEAIEQFSLLLRDREDRSVLNNLGFCQLMMGNVTEAQINTRKACAVQYEPLFELNKGIASYLSGDASSARACFHEILRRLEGADNEWLEATVTLIINFDKKTVNGYREVRVDTATIANLWRIGELTIEQAKESIGEISLDQLTRVSSVFLDDIWSPDSRH